MVSFWIYANFQTRIFSLGTTSFSMLDICNWNNTKDCVDNNSLFQLSCTRKSMSEQKWHDNQNSIGYTKDHSLEILTTWIQLRSKGIVTPPDQQLCCRSLHTVIKHISICTLTHAASKRRLMAKVHHRTNAWAQYWIDMIKVIRNLKGKCTWKGDVGTRYMLILHVLFGVRTQKLFHLWQRCIC